MSTRGPLEICFSTNHPTAAGHFPGNPIIPGAVLLDEVLRAIVVDAGGTIAPAMIRSAKFHQPVRPGDRVLIRWELRSNREIRFECLLPNSEQLVMTGSATPIKVAR